MALPMERVSPGFGPIGDLRSCGAPVLAGIAVTDDGRFLDLVLAEQHSKNSADVGVRYNEVSIHMMFDGAVIIHSIQGEQIRRTGHPQDGKISGAGDADPV